MELEDSAKFHRFLFHFPVLVSREPRVLTKSFCLSFSILTFLATDLMILTFRERRTIPINRSNKEIIEAINVQRDILSLKIVN